MTSVLVFPGLGCQRPGMGASLFDRYPAMVEQADEILGYSLRTLCAGDPERPLSCLRYAQPAVFAVNAMAGRQWVETRGVEPRCALGYSLGEFNALVAAHALSFRDALALVVQRARLTSSIDGGMAAVTGLTVGEIRTCLHWRFIDGLDIAAVNAQREVILAGPRIQLSIATAALQAVGADRVIPLRVSVPFHSRYMSEPAERFAKALKRVALKKPDFPVVANRTARPHRSNGMFAHLSAQVADTVLWADSLKYVATRYPDCDFQEVGGAGTLVTVDRHGRLAQPGAPLVTPVRWE
ncbi:ACP S-malonyltransferase [Streptomyces eurythermus]|uniref:ACP S-malonyltransferase n=1 Tax=Streptomyces eurythermus TaxID=42237 RepID=UPI0036D265DC